MVMFPISASTFARLGRLSNRCRMRSKPFVKLQERLSFVMSTITLLFLQRGERTPTVRSLLRIMFLYSQVPL